MPCPHNEITIVQRSQRQSAVAAAAYQSGEKLFCEYDQEVKHYPEKRGIVHNEILLPANAPQEYADRNTLWNAAEAVEKQWNSQLARRWVLTIPREIPSDQYAVLVREFCQQQFVSKGYCGLHISVGHLPGAGFHCGRYHAFPDSASLAGRIHRTVFRHSGKQRRQSQTAVGCAAQ